MKKIALIVLVSVLLSCLGFSQSIFADEALLVSSDYTVTYSDAAYSGNNTVSGIPVSTSVNTFLYNIRRDNPDLLINMFDYDNTVPQLFGAISDYDDRKAYIVVRETAADAGTKFLLISEITDNFADDFESYPKGMFVYNSNWKFNKYRDNAGYTAICEEDGNQFLRQCVPCASDADYEENTATKTYTIGPNHIKVEKGDVAEMKFRLRRTGGNIYVQLRDSITTADGHNLRLINSFSNTLTVFYSSVYVTNNYGYTDAKGENKKYFEDGTWVDFRIVFDRQNDDDAKNYISIYIEGSQTAITRRIRFSDYPIFLWEDFRVSFGFNTSSINQKRAELDIDDFSFTTNDQSAAKSDKLYVYGKDENSSLEYSGVLFDGDNSLKLEVNPHLNRTVKFIAAEKQNGTLVGIKIAQGTISSSGKVTLPLNFNVKSAAKSEVEIYLWHNSSLTPLKDVMGLEVSKTSIASANGHPRVVATAADFERIRKSTDPTHSAWKATVLKRADTIYTNFTTTNAKSEYYIGDGENFQTVVNRIKEYGTVLGMAYQLTLDKKYSEKLYEASIAATKLSGVTDGTMGNLTVSYLVEGLSLCYDWCYDAYTPQQREAIASFATEKCLGFAIGEYHNLERGSHTWSTTYTNHNSIPNANFITASVAFADYSPVVCETVLYYAGERLKNYLAGLAPDGGWWEGEMYTNLVFAHLAKASETLRINFGTDYIITATPAIKGSADYHIAVKGPLGTYNFAELQNPNQYCMPEVLWLANAYNRKDVKKWALDNINFASGKQCALALIWVPDTSDVEEWTFKNHYVRGTENFTMGTGSSGNANWLSILGGVNMGSHKHLDLGSFIYDSEGVRWATELGLNNYYKGYHCESSVEKIYYRSRSEGHNTLVINPTSADGGQRMNDKNGISRGEVVNYSLRNDKPFAVYDLSTAYSDKALSVKRGFRFTDGNKGFIVRDEFTTKNDENETKEDEVYWFMHTDASIQISDGGKSAILTQSGKTLKLSLLEDNLSFEVADAITPEPIRSELMAYSKAHGLELHKQNWNGYKDGDTDTSNDKKKLQIKHTGTGNGTITVMFAPVGVSMPSDISMALDDWN